jgi:hypothetical protein
MFSYLKNREEVDDGGRCEGGCCGKMLEEDVGGRCWRKMMQPIMYTLP